jgi:hypothetical protein
MTDKKKSPMPLNSVTGSHEPLSLTERQQRLCARLDELHAAVGRTDAPPSEMLIGALYTMRPAQRGRNPDWMAQAAHSLRELLYPFYKNSATRRDAFVRYGAAGDAGALSKAISAHYGLMTSIAHHEWSQALSSPIVKAWGVAKDADRINVFESTVSAFEDVLLRALRRQLDVHSDVDKFLSEGLNDVAHLRELLAVNFDGRRYFYATATGEVFQWLRDNGFLRPVAGAPGDSSQLSYRTPELDYLLKVAATKPGEVVDFMLTVPIAEGRLNPEVVDRLLWICQDLPADHLARVLPKCRAEGWPRLAARFNFSEFAYQRMFQRLVAAGDYASVVLLAEAVLMVRQRDDTGPAERNLLFDPFFIRDLEYTHVFESLAKVDETNAESALALASAVLGAIVRLGTAASHPPFEIDEPFSLYDKDLFELEIGEGDRPVRRDSIEDIATLVVLLLRKTIGRNCPDQPEARRIYSRYLLPLPESRSVWALRLVAMSLCPEAFLPELRKEIFRIFDGEHPYALTAGAEYHHTLKSAFEMLSASDRSDYFGRVLERFGTDAAEPRDSALGWRLLSGAYSGRCRP